MCLSSVGKDYWKGFGEEKEREQSSRDEQWLTAVHRSATSSEGRKRGVEALGFMPRQILWLELVRMESEMALRQQQQLQKMWPGEKMEHKTSRCAELKEFCPEKLS